MKTFSSVISPESCAVTLVCLADLLSTLFLVCYREATEGNPLMAFYLAQGLLIFVLAKTALCVPPLFVAEYARRQRPRLVRAGLRMTFALYLLAYLVGVAQLNHA